MHFQEDQRRTATTPEAQRVGRTLLQRLATGATSVKQARYKQLPTDYYEEHVRACVVYRALRVCVDSAICLHPEPASKNSAEGFALSCIWQS